MSYASGNVVARKEYVGKVRRKNPFANSPSRFIGMSTGWTNEDRDGPCQICEGKEMSYGDYCLKCDRSGTDIYVKQYRVESKVFLNKDKGCALTGQ